MSFLLNQVWGRIVKVGGLMGRPDLLFVYDADEIEKVRIIINLFTSTSTTVDLTQQRILQKRAPETQTFLRFFHSATETKGRHLSDPVCQGKWAPEASSNIYGTKMFNCLVSLSAWSNTRASCAKTSSAIFPVSSECMARSGKSFGRVSRSPSCSFRRFVGMLSRWNRSPMTSWRDAHTSSTRTASCRTTLPMRFTNGRSNASA